MDHLKRQKKILLANNPRSQQSYLNDTNDENFQTKPVSLDKRIKLRSIEISSGTTCAPKKEYDKKLNPLASQQKKLLTKPLRRATTGSAIERKLNSLYERDNSKLIESRHLSTKDISKNASFSCLSKPPSKRLSMLYEQGKSKLIKSRQRSFSATKSKPNIPSNSTNQPSQLFTNLYEESRKKLLLKKKTPKEKLNKSSSHKNRSKKIPLDFSVIKLTKSRKEQDYFGKEKRRKMDLAEKKNKQWFPVY